MTSYGLTDWDSVNFKGNNKKSSKDLYLKLAQGNNIVRILTKPASYLVHFYKAHEDDPGFGTRILSSQYHGADPLVEKGLKPKTRWLFGVIDRTTGTYKLLDVSYSVIKGVRELVNDEDWGDPTQYDINIKVDKEGGPTGYYAIVPKSKKPLSAEDLMLKESVDLDDIKRRCTPPTYDQVVEKVKMVEDNSPNLKKADVSEEDVKDEVEQDSSVDDEEVDFPAADGSDPE